VKTSTALDLCYLVVITRTGARPGSPMVMGPDASAAQAEALRNAALATAQEAQDAWLDARPSSCLDHSGPPHRHDSDGEPCL
jgi:hypothetical protein